MQRDTATKSNKRAVEPIERVSEVLFGLIMVLTFTGALSAAESGPTEVRTMLFGAIGCNLAWGFIDAIMYLMACLSERAANLRIILAVRRAATPEEAQRVIAAALPPVVASALLPEDLERVRAQLNKLRDLPDKSRLQRADWQGAAGVFLLVFLSTVPVVMPFVFIQDPVTALRVSNAIAIAMLFATGYVFGHLAGYRPLVTGGSMVLLGILLVGLTIALGG